MSVPLLAMSFDALGTLLHPREPIGRTYARLGRPYGVSASEEEIADTLRAVLARRAPEAAPTGEGRPHWRRIVREVTGSSDDDYFELLYTTFARADAWTLSAGTLEALDELGVLGIKRAVTSNWDERLRPLLGELGVLERLEVLVVSGEVGLAKPDPRIYRRLVEELGVPAESVMHIGDDPRNDVEAAAAAGLRTARWG